MSLKHVMSSCSRGRMPFSTLNTSGQSAVPSGTRATLGIVRGGTMSEANGGVERSETVPEGTADCPEASQSIHAHLSNGTAAGVITRNVQVTDFC